MTECPRCRDVHRALLPAGACRAIWVAGRPGDMPLWCVPAAVGGEGEQAIAWTLMLPPSRNSAGRGSRSWVGGVLDVSGRGVVEGLASSALQTGCSVLRKLCPSLAGSGVGSREEGRRQHLQFQDSVKALSPSWVEEGWLTAWSRKCSLKLDGRGNESSSPCGLLEA